MDLHYCFDGDVCMLDGELIEVDEPNFIYHIDEYGDPEKLKVIYYQDALRAAAIKYIYEFGDFVASVYKEEK